MLVYVGDDGKFLYVLVTWFALIRRVCNLFAHHPFPSRANSIHIEISRFSAHSRLSVSLSLTKELLLRARRILFFSEKDRSLKRFYGKLILAVSDRARRPLCDDLLRSNPARATLPYNDAYHLLKGEAETVIQPLYRYFSVAIEASMFFNKN